MPKQTCSPGFVWRLQTDSGNATSVLPFDERTLVNLSVWESLEALRAFVVSGAHGEGFSQSFPKW